MTSEGRYKTFIVTPGKDKECGEVILMTERLEAPAEVTLTDNDMLTVEMEEHGEH